jgi:hypothetical protein
MFSLLGSSARLCDGLSRREWLRVGGLGTLGLSLPALLQARDTAPAGVLPTDKTFGKAKNVIFLYLLGGPPQHETFDPKPEAPLEVRGPFQPIHTNVPGIDFCELLPRTARIADKLAICRSISTDDNNHDSSGYQLLTGYKYVGPNSRTIQPTDWPCFASLLKMLKPSEVLPPLSSVMIPDVWRLNENVTPAGQTAGFLGSQWNPDVFVGDPAWPDYRVQGLQLSSLPPLRIRQREDLLQQVERHFGHVERGELARNYDKFQRQSFELMTSSRARDAFDLSKEPDALRLAYGTTTWGQSLLLARRLIEAGVRLVHVNWPREPGDNAVDNPLWDTHAQNADRVEDVLCPQFDVSFTALINDLDQRGLLSETLVVAIGEFGRTPKINGNGGRDHWGPVFSFAMAGAGIAAGQVYGASDASGAYPARDKVSGGDFTATIFHLLGVPHTSTFHDREGREHKLTLGAPIYPLLGLDLATNERRESTGDIARVPPFSQVTLLNTDFEANVPLYSGDTSRPKGWRAFPLLDDLDTNPTHQRGTSARGLAAKLVTDDPARSHSGRRHVILGLPQPSSVDLHFTKGQTAFLAQEVRSPFAGRYVMKAHVRGDGSSREFFEAEFLKHFTCRLQFFQFTTPAKIATERKELASIPFVPRFFDDGQAGFDRFELEKVFENPNPGANFSFGLGLGAAIVLEKTSEAILTVPANAAAFLRIDDVTVEFTGKARIETVKV